jgi:hypothetical protein
MDILPHRSSPGHGAESPGGFGIFSTARRTIELAAQLEKRRPENEKFLSGVTGHIEEKMSEAGIPIVSVEGRVKRLYSIWKAQATKISLDQFMTWLRHAYHPE